MANSKKAVLTGALAAIVLLTAGLAAGWWLRGNEGGSMAGYLYS